eukprot:10893869-Alexandrium_andersonii.AAC.1
MGVAERPGGFRLATKGAVARRLGGTDHRPRGRLQSLEPRGMFCKLRCFGVRTLLRSSSFERLKQ